MKINSRVTAIKLLLRVIEDGHSLTSVLATADLQHTQANLVKELCFGVCRWYFRLKILADALLSKSLRAKDHDVYLLILLGLYQLLHLSIPQHAAVLETVEAAKVLKKPWATKLINGVLRAFLRQKDRGSAAADNTLVGRYAHPQWMIDNISAAWPDAKEFILDANNQHPPLCLRVNALQVTREDYLKQLAEMRIDAIDVADAPYAVILDRPQDVSQLPGFREGLFSVQDSSAQFAAPLLSLMPGQRVLDACAAPGGKTTHILEIEPNLDSLIAIDKEEARVTRIKSNVQRLNLSPIVQYHVADALETSKWWDGKHFDRILLDAPCSGTGVIRRHPDIKLLRQPEDIPKLAQQQQALLEALWPLLKSGGVLLYATCSIFPEENEKVMQAFLSRHADAQEQLIVATWGIAVRHGRQILTGYENRDGFYYARLIKL